MGSSVWCRRWPTTTLRIRSQRQVWVAIGAKDWAPKVDYPKVRIVSPPRALSPVWCRAPHHRRGRGGGLLCRQSRWPDAFRNARLVDRSVAVESLRSAIDQRKATPAEIAQAAKDCGARRDHAPLISSLCERRTAKDITNLAASVRQRLRNLSLEKQRDFGLVLVNYGLERLIYRLVQSRHRDQFVLKGGMLVTVWTGDDHRTTRDADFLGFGELDEERLREIFADIMAIDGKDGLMFDAEQLTAAAMPGAQHRRRRPAQEAVAMLDGGTHPDHHRRGPRRTPADPARARHRLSLTARNTDPEYPRLSAPKRSSPKSFRRLWRWAS